MQQNHNDVFGRSNYPNIFKAGQIGNFRIPNRVKYAACSVSNFNSHDGFVSERELFRDEVIAKTGAAILTNQGVYPDSKGEGKVYPRQLAMSDDRYIPSMRQITTMWRKLAPPGTLHLAQILHGGRYGGHDLEYSLQPSLIPQKVRKFKPPKEATREDIERSIDDHVKASERLILSGFDGVEITAFTGYLLANFNSKYTNKRTDEYGGSLENRARLMVELLTALRKALGNNLVVGVRLNGTEQLPGGNSDEECVEFMKIAESVGVDYISVVIAWHESDYGALGRHLPPDHWLYLLEDIRKAVSIPICYGPQLRDPFIAEKTLASGLIDYWELCRPFLADPELVQKTARNRVDEIKPCIGDLMCISKFIEGQPYICTCNPTLGHEGDTEYKAAPLVRRKKVMVVGGGAAGIEAALMAHKRGHEVLLYEKTDRVGGQLLCAGADPHGGYNYGNLLEWYERQLRQAGIDVLLNTEVNEKTIRSHYPYLPDVLILATGSEIRMPPIPGIQGPNVYSAFDVLRGKKVEGKSVAVIGAGKVGSPLALKLQQSGKTVTVIEENRSATWDLGASFKFRTMAWLKEAAKGGNGFRIITQARPKEITEQGIVICHADGTQQVIEAESVVFAYRVANQELMPYVTLNTDELAIVGDAVAPRFLYTAIHEGYKAGCRI